MWSILLTILFHGEFVFGSFSPDKSDFDAYGLKMAANDVLFVQAVTSGSTFLVQYAPYNYTFDSLQCSFDYDDSAHYVYSVGVGQKQNSTLNTYFYFAGEVVPSGWSGTDTTGHNGTFIGIWINQDPLDISVYSRMRRPLSCNYLQVQSLQFLMSYAHQEFYVIAVEPYGQYAIGLATDFVFIYRPFSGSQMTTKSSTSIWPNNSTFNPWAADASETFTIIAGFVANSARSRIRAVPTVYLMWNSNVTVLSTWSYSATSGSWQERLTYSDISSWSSKYTMSVKINPNDTTKVLVGMPFLNAVFLFIVTQNGTNLTLASTMNNGLSVGYGKSVTWLTSSQAAILVATYSFDYVTLYSSQVYLYTSLDDTDIPSSPSAVFPNAQQPLPSTINSKLIRIVSTPESLAILDANGGVIFILTEQAGYYPSTDTTNAPIAASMPVVSYSSTCPGGTYKPDTGLYPCILCPQGTRNPGGMMIAATSCINCSSNNFCPLGALYEMDTTMLESLSQAYAYPRSPEIDVYEDVLLHNMFSLGATAHCIVISPLFWILLLTFFFVLLLLGMASLNCCVQEPKRDQWRNKIKNIFLRTDLVGEGELWLGGLASIGVVLVTVMAYTFALTYLNLYPSEKVSASPFACDTTLRNAKFESSLQALAVPVSDEEQTIFDLLNEQKFVLQLDFLNTAISCMQLTISIVTESSTITLQFLNCSSWNGTLSATVALPEQDITIQAVIDGTELVGAIRVGLSGVGQQQGDNTLQELKFLQTFYSASPRTLAQTGTILMALTKAINETEPLSGSDAEFAGIWYPTFTYSLNEMFTTAENYIMTANLSTITLTIEISETSYYIKNIQSPIAKQPEILFRTLLFAFLCLEICAMVFLICKLLLIPLYKKIIVLFTGQPINRIEPVHSKHGNHH